MQRLVARPVTSRRLRVTFPAANTVRDIAHGLDGIPDGYVLEWADGVVYAEPGVQWTRDLAYLRATAANVHAIVTFYIASEDALDAS